MVRNRKINGFKFLRQHPILFRYYGEERFFVADFYCKDLNLIVEIDGGVHERQKYYDKIREEILETQKDLYVIRFTNDEVINHKDKILDRLLKYSKDFTHPATLPRVTPPCLQGGAGGG